MKKRGQIAGQPVLYTLSIIIFAFVLLIGYKFVNSIGDKGEKTTLILFKQELVNDIDSVDYGSVKIETYEVPTYIDKICFSDPKKNNPLLCPDCPDVSEYPIVADAISDKAKDNVFLLGGELPETLEVEQFTIGCCEFLCVDVTNGVVKLKLGGLDKKTIIQNAE